MYGKTSGEVRLFRRSYLSSTVNGSPFSEKNGFRFQMQVVRRRKKTFFSSAIK